MGKFLVLALLAASIEAVAAGWDSPVYQNFFNAPLLIASIKQPKAILTNNHTGKPIHYYEIEIKPLQQQVYPGKQTWLVGYDGISPGPTFMMEKGIESIVRFTNHGDPANSIHLHGSYSRAPFDGWAEYTTAVGSYKDYYYPNNQNAGTLWYHDHAIDHTAKKAYYGKAGFYILHDPEERALELLEGKYDIPLALAARRYNVDLSLWDTEKNGETTSVYGDVIHYRFRWCNTRISRTYRLYFELTTTDGTKPPFTVIGSDAGLLEKPVQTDNLYISIAEPDTDFTGTDRVLNKNAVTSQVGNGAIANPLRKVPYPPNKAGIDRSFAFERSNGQWQINGVTWPQVNNRIMAKPQRGAIEVWQLENKNGGWSHPIHIHLINFQVMFCTGGANRGVQPYEAVALKDVVWLGPNEKVIVMARYAPWDGDYMFHCHGLVHEDHKMMAVFNVSLR
ncbi:Cupredoxin [Halenospora varia]|nr:Cupredoxin [Halenospora varia]